MGVKLEVRIDELVLNGFAPADGPRIGAAVKRELEHLLAGSAADMGTRPDAKIARLNAGSFHVTPGASAHAIGLQVARAVDRGLIGGKRKR